MDALIVLVAFALDYLLTAFIFWLITLALTAFGVKIVFTWGLAFAFWVVIKCLKLLL